MVCVYVMCRFCRYNVLDRSDSVTLFLDGLPPHSSMTVAFDFVRIDSWDSEKAEVYVRCASGMCWVVGERGFSVTSMNDSFFDGGVG
jgi:hypothetical protein